MAIAFAPWVPRWWRPLAIVGAGLGLAAFAVVWDGQRPLFAQEGGIGVVVSVILIVSAIALAGAFG